MGAFQPATMEGAAWEDQLRKIKENDSSITQFECSNRALSLSEVRQLTEALRSNTTLNILNLSNAEINDEAMAVLSAAILESTKLPLEILDLSDNLVTEENSALCDSLRAKNITLVLNNNPGGPDLPVKKKKIAKRQGKRKRKELQEETLQDEKGEKPS